MEPAVKTKASETRTKERELSEEEKALVAHVETELAELRFSNLLTKSLALVFLLYTAVATVRWAGGLAMERLPELVRNLLT